MEKNARLLDEMLPSVSEHLIQHFVTFEDVGQKTQAAIGKMMNSWPWTDLKVFWLTVHTLWAGFV